MMDEYYSEKWDEFKKTRLQQKAIYTQTNEHYKFVVLKSCLRSQSFVVRLYYCADNKLRLIRSKYFNTFKDAKKYGMQRIKLI